MKRQIVQKTDWKLGSKPDVSSHTKIVSGPIQPRTKYSAILQPLKSSMTQVTIIEIDWWHTWIWVRYFFGQKIYTRVFFISITDFAWASQCLIFRPFEPQKMLLWCLKFTLTRFTFESKIGTIGQFWQIGSLWNANLDNCILNATQSQSKIWLKALKRLLKVKVWLSSASVNA